MIEGSNPLVADGGDGADGVNGEASMPLFEPLGPLVFGGGILSLSPEERANLNAAASALDADPVRAEAIGGGRVKVDTPGGILELELPEITGEVTPPEPRVVSPLAFQPLTFFAAPLPAGSGARAYGFAGAFTAVADDATAASWNPAGLTQNERMELSAVYRQNRNQLDYSGGDEQFIPRDVELRSDGLNYLSAVIPLRLGNQPLVFSLNAQEAFDFENRFTATIRDEQRDSFSATRMERFEARSEELRIPQLDGGRTRYNIEQIVEAEVEQRLFQSVSQELNGRVTFDQEGVVDSLSPAVAIRLGRTFSLGATLNIYQDSALGPSIRSRTINEFEIDTLTEIRRERRRMQAGLFSVEGVTVIPEFEGVVPEMRIPIATAVGELPEQVEASSSRSSSRTITEGRIIETDTLREFEGLTPTLGLLWDAHPWLTLGASLEPGMTAKARQTRVRETSITTKHPAGDILSRNDVREEASRKIEYDFPLRWSVGAAIRPNPNMLFTADVGQRLYSDFAIREDGGPDLNPLSGNRLADDPLEDTLRVAIGGEWMVPLPELPVLGRSFLPLRAGYSWEEEPALGKPDLYRGFSLGTGLVLDQMVLDISYQRRKANNIHHPLSSRQDISLDSKQDFLSISAIFYY